MLQNVLQGVLEDMLEDVLVNGFWYVQFFCKKVLNYLVTPVIGILETVIINTTTRQYANPGEYDDDEEEDQGGGNVGVSR